MSLSDYEAYRKGKILNLLKKPEKSKEEIEELLETLEKYRVTSEFFSKFGNLSKEEKIQVGIHD